MCPGYQQLGSTAVLASTPLALELALPARKYLLCLTEVAGVVHVAAIGQGGKILQPHVQGRGGTIRWDRLRHLQQTGEADVPLLGAAVDGHGLDGALDRAAPPDLDRTNAGQHQASVVYLPA